MSWSVVNRVVALNHLFLHLPPVHVVLFGHPPVPRTAHTVPNVVHIVLIPLASRSLAFHNYGNRGHGHRLVQAHFVRAHCPRIQYTSTLHCKGDFWYVDACYLPGYCGVAWGRGGTGGGGGWATV